MGKADLGWAQQQAFLHISKAILRLVGQRTSFGRPLTHPLSLSLIHTHTPKNNLFLTAKMGLLGKRWGREERHGSCPNSLAIVSDFGSLLQKVHVYALLCPPVWALLDAVHSCLHGIKMKRGDSSAYLKSLFLTTCLNCISGGQLPACPTKGQEDTSVIPCSWQRPFQRARAGAIQKNKSGSAALCPCFNEPNESAAWPGPGS